MEFPAFYEKLWKFKLLLYGLPHLIYYYREKIAGRNSDSNWRRNAGAFDTISQFENAIGQLRIDL